MNTSNLDLATLGGYTMGTTWSVKLAAPRRLDLHPLHTAIQARLDQIVAEMSTWEPNSHISRFNRAPVRSWHALPNDFDLVLRTALDIAMTSNGAFDPTVGPLVRLWGFGAYNGNHTQIPTPEAITLATTRVGWQHLERTPDGHWLQPGGTELDLSAIAKGYGVDAVAATLHAKGVEHALVDIGGELYGYGHKPDGTPWSVLVEKWISHTKMTMHCHRASYNWMDLQSPPLGTAGTTSNTKANATHTLSTLTEAPLSLTHLH